MKATRLVFLSALYLLQHPGDEVVSVHASARFADC
jgi:hypothetical protein